MTRRLEISLGKRGARCVASLLDDLAPRTCELVWGALPLEGPAYHAKYARNELYALVPSLGEDPGLENPTITPVPGDVMFFSFPKWQLATASHGYGSTETPYQGATTVDLAVFYERNNLLLNPDVGFVPGTVFARVDEGLPEIADAARDVWRAGAVGETICFARLGPAG